MIMQRIYNIFRLSSTRVSSRFTDNLNNYCTVRMTYSEADLTSKLKEALNPTFVKVIDESDGCGAKFSCVVVSSKFEGKPLLERHRLVNSAIAKELTTIHAFTQRTYTPEQWEKLKDTKPFSITAPGKIILHGEHSVVYGKLALACSLGLRTTLHLDENNDNIIKLNLPAIKLNTTIDLAKLLLQNGISADADEDNFIGIEAITQFVQSLNLGTHEQHLAVTSLIYLVLRILQPVKLLNSGLTFYVTTELTVGAGTGSSASFLVAVAAALYQYVKIKQNAPDLQVHVFNADDLEKISTAAFKAERVIHGQPSGIDNTACTYGGLVEFRKGETPIFLQMSSEMNILLINTKVDRNTKTLIEKVKELRNNHQDIIDSIFTSMDLIAGDASKYLQNLDSDAYKKLMDLIEINQNLLRTLGVSHPKLDLACNIVQKHGLVGKLTGAGGGGYAIALIPPTLTQANVEAAIKELHKNDLTVIHTKLGGRGVTLQT